MKTWLALLLTFLLLLAPASGAFARPALDPPANNSEIVVPTEDASGGTDWTVVAVLAGAGIVLVGGGMYAVSHRPRRPLGTH